MALPFQRRVGAAADVSELEYVAALHQTCPNLRKDATVSCTDVTRFLNSTSGINVSKAQGISIVKGLGGGRYSTILGSSQQSQGVEKGVAPRTRSLMRGKLSILETLFRTLWRRLFRRKKIRRVVDTTPNPSDHEPSSSKAKVLHQFSGSLASTSVVRLASNGDDDVGEGEVQSARTPTSLSKAKVLAHLGGSPGSVSKLVSTSNGGESSVPGLCHSPESKARVLVHLSGSRIEGESIRMLASSDNNNEKEDIVNELPTNRVLDFSVNENDDCQDYLDLVQLLAILVMPTLARVAREWNANRNHGLSPINEIDTMRKSPNNKKMLARVLTSMLQSLESGTDSFPTLNAKLVQNLLIAYGEYDRAADTVLIEQMVEAAHSSTFLFDDEALVNALASDLYLLDAGGTTAEKNTQHRTSRMSATRNRNSSRRYPQVPGDESVDEREVEDSIFPSAVHLDTTSVNSEVTMDIDVHSVANIKSEKKHSICIEQWVTAMESPVETAASRKIESLLKNALDLHSDTDSSEEAVTNFDRCGSSCKECGGIFWTWQRLLSGSLYNEEGISVSTTICVVQLVQLACIAFLVPAGLRFIDRAMDYSQQWYQEMTSVLLEDWVLNVVPNPALLKSILYPAFIVALLDMIAVFLVQVPSYVGTILQYRSGHPSASSAQFAACRMGVHTVYRNVGDAAWGMIGSGVLTFFLVGLFNFLFVWPPSRHVMRILVALVLVATISGPVKRLVLVRSEQRLYNGFFCLDSRLANLVTVVLECCYLAFGGGGALVLRASKLFFGATFNTGCIDESTSFAADVLQHDAHHHPYMCRLQAMYLLKLENDHFCSEAGACWRRLFVLSLMPWISKYRINSGNHRMPAVSLATSGRDSSKQSNDAILTREGKHVAPNNNDSNDNDYEESYAA